MNPVFQHTRYLLKRQKIALTGKVRIYSPDGELALYSEQKMLRLKEDIRVYSDESKMEELLLIKARNILDFAAAYDVLDGQTGQPVGVLARKGFSSMLRDQWEIRNASDLPIGVMHEDNLTRALLRRLLLGVLLPQDYDILIGDQRVADLRQRFTFFGYEMEMDFSLDASRQLDPRLGIAGGILLAIIEGRQSS
ncbi:MAG: hypothetical protein L0Z70_09565 [Chloroflexi bacterium]|nr:hypothetical protein [Chloroflexota bacterium]